MNARTWPTGVGRHNRLGVIVAGTLAVLATACAESGPQMARVQGTVTYKGQPLKVGTVSFVPNNPAQPGASSRIGPDGTYELQTREPGDGARLGEYRVIVSGVDPKILDNIKAPGQYVKMESDVPKKYAKADTSGLTATVNPGSNTLDFRLE